MSNSHNNNNNDDNEASIEEGRDLQAEIENEQPGVPIGSFAKVLGNITSENHVKKNIDVILDMNEDQWIQIRKKMNEKSSKGNKWAPMFKFYKKAIRVGKEINTNGHTNEVEIELAKLYRSMHTYLASGTKKGLRNDPDYKPSASAKRRTPIGTIPLENPIKKEQ